MLGLGWIVPRVAAVAILAAAVIPDFALAQRADRPDVRVGDEWRFAVYYTVPSAVPNRHWVIKSVTPAGYGCPCHGGQYDPEGNRIAGPPVRALDRYGFEIDHGRLILLSLYSVSHVVGTGGQAKIYKYKEAGPGEHLDGPEQLLYPLQPPHN